MTFDRFHPYLIAVLSASLIMAIFAGFDRDRRGRAADAQREAVLDRLKDVQRDVARQIDSDLIVAQGLAARIAIAGDITAREFDAWGGRLVASHAYVRRLSLSRGTVIWRTFPLTGNEHVIGIDYLKDGIRRQAVQTAISAHRTVVSGPLMLQEMGGYVLIVRVPIWHDLTEKQPSESTFFGLVSVIIDVNKILNVVQSSDMANHNTISLQVTMDGNEQSETVVGDPAIFREPHVSSDLVIDGNCRIQFAAAVDVNDMASGNRDDFNFLMLSLMASGVIGGLALFLSQNYERHRLCSLHDPLTHLANRRLANETCDQVLRQAQRNKGHAAVLMIDLDDFKAINDTYGHAVGDLALMTVAQRLKSSARSCDIVARLGGDEFMVILSSPTSRHDCDTLAGRLSDTLTESIQVPGGHCRVGVSIGIAIYPEDGTTPDALANAADVAMYHVKRAGKGGWGIGCVVFRASEQTDKNRDSQFGGDRSVDNER